MNKILRNTIAALLLTCLAPMFWAFSLEENINLDAKGGCTTAIVMHLPENCQGLYKAVMRVLSEDGSDGLLDEKAVRTYFSYFPEFNLQSYHVYRRTNEVMVQVVLYSTNARKALATGAVGDIAIGPSAKALGDTEIKIVLPRLNTQPFERLCQRANSLAQFVGGISFVVRLGTPTEILETTGEKDSFNRCTWRISLKEMLDADYPDIKARW